MHHDVYLMNIPLDSTKTQKSVSAQTLRPIFFRNNASEK